MENKNVYRELCNDIRDACVENEVTAIIVDDVLKSFIEVAIEILEHGGTVSLPNFGMLSTKIMKGRNGVNPKTKEPLIIPDKCKVKFKSYSKLEDRVQKQLKK